MTIKPLNFWGYLIIGTLFLFLSYGGFLAYKSIDWQVLDRLESSPLNLPSPVVTSAIATPSIGTQVQNR